MTTSSVVTPTNTVVAPDSYTGAASSWEALVGLDDSSYISVISTDPDAVFGLENITMPAGAMFKSVELTVRHRWVTDATGFNAKLTFWNPDAKERQGFSPTLSVWSGDASSSFTAHDTGFVEPTLGYSGAVTNSILDSLKFQCLSTNGSSQSDFSRVKVQYVYVTKPVVAVNAVTPDPWTASTTPDVSWVNTLDEDGGGQTRYHIRVFDETTYGVGFSGLDPETDTPYYDSGEKVGSANEASVGPLENGDTYRAYIKVAQTVVGEAHWSAWAYDEFDVSVTTSDINTVTTSEDVGDANIIVEVARDLASQAWDRIEIQRSIDSGVTWSDVRWSTYVDCTADPDDYAGADHEVPNGVATLHRARATRLVSGLPVTGSWVQSTPASWTSTDTWLKVPEAWDENLTVTLRRAVSLARPARRGVFNILGEANPVVVSDTRGAVRSTILLATETLAEIDTIMDVLTTRDVVLLQTPTDQPWGSRYISIGSVNVVPVVTATVRPHATIELIDVVEVGSPPDPTAGR